MILITGANGFVGSALLSRLNANSIRVLGRKLPSDFLADRFYKQEINHFEDYSRALSNGVETVIHLAARVHVMDDKVTNPLEEYRNTNVYGTMNLARQAVKAGVKRFIFLSSIKVSGESTEREMPFCSFSDYCPEDYYGVSKAEAEKELFKLAKETGLEVVVIRPTLVYGPGVKANFASLLDLVYKGIPLPFSFIDKNKRSLVSVDNLVDLIVTCIEHPNAVNQVFCVTDDKDVSTSDLVYKLCLALDKKTWQIPVPIWLFKLIGKILNKTSVVERLTNSLQVDITHTKQTLAWVPPQTLEDGLKKTADAFIHSKISRGSK
nr:SDR family oxidoreductase [Vibrio vulnificus]